MGTHNTTTGLTTAYRVSFRKTEMKTAETQGRVRNWSADSGCDVDLHLYLKEQEDDISSQMLEENLSLWTSMLESLLRKKLDKVREDLKLTFRDEAAKVLRLNEVKKSSLTFLLETTNILEQVSRDVKGIIAQKFEDLQHQEKEGESDQNCTKRKAAGQIQHRHHKLRRFEFLDDFEMTADTETMFDDWDWSSDEFDCDEKTDKLADKEPAGCTKLHLNFYDDSDVRNDWNDFNFWKFSFSSPVLASLQIDIQAEDRIALEEAGADDLLMECEAEAQPDSQTLTSPTPSQILLSMKPPRYQLETKYLWPQGENRILFETRKRDRNQRKYAGLLLKQP